jgi:NADH:ubiquinone oxidoreductase subunit 6 (subunit J)
MTVAEVVFYGFALVAIVTAIGVVTVPNVVHAALMLIASLAAVAGFYILLSSEFLALVQVLIYAGGIATIILFGLMLTRGRELPTVSVGAQWPVAFLVTSVLAITLLAGIIETDWPRDAGEVTVVGIQALGNALFEPWLLPFEIASVVLTVALIGAVVISRPEEGEA